MASLLSVFEDKEDFELGLLKKSTLASSLVSAYSFGISILRILWEWIDNRL